MSALLKRDPCDYCDERRTIHAEPPYDICRRSGGDLFECSAVEEAEALCEKAAEVISILRTIEKPEWRREVAESVADAFANALYEVHGQPQLDAKEFVRRCMEVEVAA